MVNPLVILIIGFVIYLLLDSISHILSSIGVFIYFLFIYVNVPTTQSVATFYLVAMLFVIAAQFAERKFAVGEEQNKVKRFSWRGVKFDLLGLGIGIAIYFFMTIIQSGRPEGTIIGVPTLAISFTALAPFTSAILGIVENRTFFTIFNLLRRFQILNVFALVPVLNFIAPIFPFFAVAFLFAIFHLIAFSVALGLLIWAGLIFALWLISYIYTGSDLAANTAHYIWNGSIAVGKQLTILGG